MSEFVPLQHSHVSVCIGCLITLLFARLGFFLTEAAYQHGDATIFSVGHRIQKALWPSMKSSDQLSTL